MIQINGTIHKTLFAASRALRYGDGLFETIRLERGMSALWPWHSRRILDSAARLSIALDATELEAEWQLFVERLQALNSSDGIVRLSLIRGGDRRGYAPQADAEPYRQFEYFAELPRWGGRVDALVCETRLGSQPLLAGMKHLNRLEQVLAAAEAQKAGVETGVMLDQGGTLVCGIDANLVLETESGLLTPELSQSGIAGVFRAYMIEVLCPQLEIDITIQPISLEQLRGARAVGLSNAVRGLRSVQSLQCRGQTLQLAPGEVLMQLNALARKNLGVQGF